MTEQWN